MVKQSAEKIAFGYYVDGRVSAVLGTHKDTVPTGDGKDSSKRHSIPMLCWDDWTIWKVLLGVKKKQLLNVVLRVYHDTFRVVEDEVQLCATLLHFDGTVYKH